MKGEKKIDNLLLEKRFAEEREEIRKRTLYIPKMNYAGAMALAAVLRSVDINAQVSPDDNREAFELAGKYLSGDECLPERVTLGGLLKVLMIDKVPQEKVAFFMPTAGGPCRFGQYRSLIKEVLKNLGFDDVLILSPSSNDGYRGIAEAATEVIRTSWWAIVSSDVIFKMLLKTRPYEINKGDADNVFTRATDTICKILEQKTGIKNKMDQMVDAHIMIRDEFRDIPVNYTKEKPLIGIVGEIFCRMNPFSNEDLVKKVEELGGECWISDISEWIWYTNRETIKRVIDAGKRFSKDMLIEKIKSRIQHRDEHILMKPFIEDIKGYEEPKNIHIILDAAFPYLPVDGALGEMVLSAGKSIYLYENGVDGIIDISPFTCMNGIVTEAIYPELSRDHDNIPIKNFYFDGTVTDLERDLDIFMELARNYKLNKKKKRVYPRYFNDYQEKLGA
ncbi:MAG: hypothetical protein SVR08_09265 [Spirochaetota bacterium]|nr:hypothetical protein [Spirochaetota bacterium]